MKANGTLPISGGGSISNVLLPGYIVITDHIGMQLAIHFQYLESVLELLASLSDGIHDETLMPGFGPLELELTKNRYGVVFFKVDSLTEEHHTLNDTISLSIVGPGSASWNHIGPIHLVGMKALEGLFDAIETLETETPRTLLIDHEATGRAHWMDRLRHWHMLEATSPKELPEQSGLNYP